MVRKLQAKCLLSFVASRYTLLDATFRFLKFLA